MGATAKRNRAKEDGEAIRTFSREIPLDLIDASPYQPRQDFAEEEIRGLADSIVGNGLLQPILVRPTSTGHYELMEGERRVRAMRLLGRETISAVVRQATDAQAREIVLVAQIQRKAFNAIEEASAFQAILQQPDAPTQQELADRLGVSQPHIANRLRLLRLPAKIQRRIISGEMTPTHGRQLVPLLEIPGAAKSIEDLIEQVAGGKAWEASTIGALFDDPDQNSLLQAVLQVAPELPHPRGRHWPRLHGKVYYSAEAPNLVPTAEQREQLDLREVDIGGRKMTVACNAKLLEQLIEAHDAAWLAKKAKKGKSRDEVRGAGAEPAEMTEAQREKEEAREKQRLRKLAEQKRRRLEELAVHWLRCLIAERILDVTKTTQEEMLGLAIEAATAWPVQGYHAGRGGPKAPAKGHVTDRMAALLAACFWNAKDKEPSLIVPAPAVKRWAAELQIDVEAAWNQNQLGPLTEAFWKTLGKDRCTKIAMGAGIDVAGMKAVEMIDAIMVSEVNVAMPAELQSVLGIGKKGRKAKA